MSSLDLGPAVFLWASLLKGGWQRLGLTRRFAVSQDKAGIDSHTLGKKATQGDFDRGLSANKIRPSWLEMVERRLLKDSACFEMEVRSRPARAPN